MEEQLNYPLAATHLLQHTLRTLCINENSQWVYAVLWRIIPRNYPPPKWDLSTGAYDRSRGNRRNWILSWEDGFCNFAASACHDQQMMSEGSSSAATQDCEVVKGLQPELFFKMSHEIYNYGEGLIGKVAADHTHKWVFNDPQDHHETTSNFYCSWNNTTDSQPRTWEAQFQSGIKTIALIAVREGVIQLGAVNKVNEDLNFVVQLRKKFNYLESIPGVFLQHPSPSFAAPMIDNFIDIADNWPQPHFPSSLSPFELFNSFSEQTTMPASSMNSLETLLLKLPAVSPTTITSAVCSPCHYSHEMPSMLMQAQKPQMSVIGRERIAKEEAIEEEYHGMHCSKPCIE